MKSSGGFELERLPGWPLDVLAERGLQERLRDRVLQGSRPVAAARTMSLKISWPKKPQAERRSAKSPGARR